MSDEATREQFLAGNPPDLNRRAAMSPGDDAVPGSPDSGEGLCPACSGSGRLDGRPCATCSGTGKVVETISGE